MAEQIQTNYPLSQERGQLGSLSRPLAPCDADAVVIAATGAGLQPGDAFKLDGSGEAIPLALLADVPEGVLSFQIGQINQTLAGGTENNSGIAYAEGDKAKYWRMGYVYGIAGAALAKKAEIGQDPTTKKWVAQAGTGIYAADAVAADGDVVEVMLRVNA